MSYNQWIENNRGVSPYMYGRYLQAFIDLSKVEHGKDRRYRIVAATEQRTPDQIVDEARTILLRMKNTNGLCTFDTEHPQQEGLSNDQCLYLGRCVQFLLDTNRKRYTYDEITALPVKDVINLAHDIKMNLLIYQCGPYEIDDDGCDDDCMWSPSNGRCDCGNRRVHFEYTGDIHLDDNSPNGYPEYY